MDNGKINKKHAIIAIGVLLLIISIIASICIPTTCIVKESYTEEYLVPVYKTVTHNDPIYADKYRTVTHNDPIYEDKYKTVTHRDPIWAELCTYKLDDIGDGESAYIVKNAHNTKETYTGTDFWGNKNYNVVVYYFIGTVETQKEFHEINSIVITDTYQGIIGYNKWTEKVLDGQKIVGYDTWTEQVLDGKKVTGYNTWTEKVVDKYDTKERIAYKDVKYKMSLADAILCGADKIVLDL